MLFVSTGQIGMETGGSCVGGDGGRPGWTVGCTGSAGGLGTGSKHKKKHENQRDLSTPRVVAYLL